MKTLRLARLAARVQPVTTFRQPLQRRGYADAVSDKIKLTLALPHQSIYKSTDVVQVNIPAESGEMGVLANHVPSIEQLKPGLVEIIEESGGSKQFFCACGSLCPLEANLSGGFAVVQPGSQLSINAVEGFPLEDFSSEAVRSQVTEAQKIATGGGSEQDVAEAKIELEPMADETLVAKGFVSTKVDALRKSSAASGDSHAPHPPSYPRARFERVQTYGDWPAYNAKLYNQPHPRTMSLAPNSVPGKFDPSQHEQQEKLGQRQHQNKPPPSRTLGVRGLQHLWESKGQSYNAIDALQYRSATSSADGAVVDDLGPLTSADSWTTPHNPARKAIPPDSLPLHHRVPRTEDISDGPEISNGSLNESSKADGHGFETSLDTDIPPRKEAGRPAEKGQPPPDRKVPGLNFDFSRHLGARSSFHVTTFDTPKSQIPKKRKKNMDRAIHPRTRPPIHQENITRWIRQSLETLHTGERDLSVATSLQNQALHGHLGTMPRV
ncbi:MAG: hypothetical protein L6R40_001294 [Gallowayella cf. fulva]|nr:MAG: hypothetical protein L6R40_001294 [Xanthomendoza cf. fulva]